MTRFSASDAALEGFNVLRDHWRVVVGWSLFNIIALVTLAVIGAIVTFGAMAASTGGAVTFNAALGGFLASLGEMFTVAILAGGLFRLMLRPQEPAFLHLRIGPNELRILAVWLALWLGAVLLVGASALAIRAVGGVGPALALPIWLAVVAVGVWLALRFSLAPVISFDERRFTLRSSWRLTRGRALALLGMALLNASVVALLSLLVLMAVFVATGVSVGFGALFDAMRDPEVVKDHPGIYVADLAVELVLSPVLGVLVLAPWVAAYRAFRDEAQAIA